MQEEERLKHRRNPRLKVNWPFSISCEGCEIKGLTGDISESGVLLSATEPIKMHKNCRIELKPPGKKKLKLSCKVVWSDLYGIGPDEEVFGLGACFIELTPNDRRLLQDLISHVGSIQRKTP